MITTLKGLTIRDIKDYVNLLPSRTVIKEYESRTIIVDNLSDSEIILERGAKLQFVYLGNSGLDNPTKIKFVFDGKDSELIFLGFIIGRGEDLYDFEAISEQKTPETKAYFHLHAALYDKSRVNFKGKLIIDKEAQLSDAYLSHRTLLLSEKSRTTTIPALEISADDVKAGHAATVGKVSQEDLFYLSGRGIDPGTAEQLLILGFFEKQLAMISDEDLRNTLRQTIIRSLPFQHPDFFV